MATPPPAGKTEAKLLLRTLPLEYEFRKDTYGEQVGTEVNDKSRDGTSWLKLGANVTTAMALNEVAASQGRGFFLHLPSRETNSRFAGKGRNPPAPGPLYPNLVYMDYAWAGNSRERFAATPQRARYLVSNALMNPPLGNTPLHSIQYARHKNVPLYMTPRPSLIILQIESFYVVPSTEAVEALRLKSKADGRLPGLRAAWDGDHRHLEPYRCNDVESLYSRILELCSRPTATMTAEELHRILPRPPPWHDGTPLGTVEVVKDNASGPSSKRGARYTRGKR
ncbi:hypothetical protein DM02DRAFT_648946 [Periconia macrospinosa]|uniref:Uncharacterized protein n=1 Tax=Periconia macrospinosa TaxID=97972 RepID=A0A2V1EBC6_9PLEO|nr:hypothetical protein DM02DRAFT_648946 [Periconia macrospinosa]